jgi:hypothetical protein
MYIHNNICIIRDLLHCILKDALQSVSGVLGGTLAIVIRVYYCDSETLLVSIQPFQIAEAQSALLTGKLKIEYSLHERPCHKSGKFDLIVPDCLKHLFQIARIIILPLYVVDTFFEAHQMFVLGGETTLCDSDRDVVWLAVPLVNVSSQLPETPWYCASV